MDDQRIGYHPNPEQNARNKALRCAIIKAFDWHKRNEIFYYGIGQVFRGHHSACCAGIRQRAGLVTGHT